jgi:hypothetical protein
MHGQAKPPPQPQVHENLEHLQRLLALGLARHGLTGREALDWAARIIEILQESLGGDRLGSKGFYIPAPNHRQRRDDRIRELMGQPPHSRRRVEEVAAKEGCAARTVWRVLGALPPVP